MRFLAAPRRPSVINVTSLIDVMFLLLIFVLLSAKFEKEASVPVNLPAGGKAESGEKPTLKVLTIDAQGAMFLGQEPVEMQNLAAAIDLHVALFHTRSCSSFVSCRRPGHGNRTRQRRILVLPRLR